MKTIASEARQISIDNLEKGNLAAWIERAEDEILKAAHCGRFETIIPVGLVGAVDIDAATSILRDYGFKIIETSRPMPTLKQHAAGWMDITEDTKFGVVVRWA